MTHRLFVAAIRAAWVCSIWPIRAGAQTDFDLEIRTGVLVRIPIHVEEILYEGGLSPISFANGETPDQVLVKDLEYSSFFRVSSGPAAPAGPASAGRHRSAGRPRHRLGHDPEVVGKGRAHGGFA